jgi:hypothetical protein
MRLLRLFQKHKIPTAPHLFDTFDAYCASLGPSVSVKRATKRRVDAVWAAYTTLAQQTDILFGNLVGYFVDAHYPLFASGVDAVQMVYKNRLAPEQQIGFPLLINGPSETLHATETMLKRIIGTIVGGALDDVCGPAHKLIAKGRPFPRSVRYIRPQLARCIADPNASQLANFVLKVHQLQAYPHINTSVGPAARFVIYGTPVEETVSAVNEGSSRVLYKIISEAIAGCLIGDVELLVRGERCWGDLTAYIHTSLSPISTVESKQRKPPPLHVVAPTPMNRAAYKVLDTLDTDAAKRFLLRETATTLQQNAIQQWPVHPDGSALQRTACLADKGVADIYAYGCGLCGTLHTRVPTVKRISRSRAGVSLCISSTPAKVYCNTCAQSIFIKSFRLTGHITRALLFANDKAKTIFVVCAHCTQVSIDPTPHGILLLCKPCAAAARMKQLNNVLCVCGARCIPNGNIFMCLVNGVAEMRGGCHLHIHNISFATPPELVDIAEYKRLLTMSVV